MRVLVMGAGAVGSYYGARLAQAGYSVVFVGRGAHLAAMRDRGLELRAGDQATLLSPVEAVERPERSASPIDLVLLTVKGYDTAAAIDALRPVVESQTVVLPLLNGVDAPDQLAEAFGAERVLAGTTTVNVAIVEPGVVLERGVPIRTTIAELSGGLSQRTADIAQALQPTSQEIIVSDDAALALWQKFVLLAPHGTITAAVGLPVGAIRNLAEGAALYRQLVHEAVAVGRACGVRLPDDTAEMIIQFIMESLPPTAISSLAADFERRRPVELEQITGAIVRRGQATGVPTPGFDPLYAVLKARAASFGH